MTDRVEDYRVPGGRNSGPGDARQSSSKKGVALSDILVRTVDRSGAPKPPCDQCLGWLERHSDAFYRIKRIS
jgi:hypothetical protein